MPGTSMRLRTWLEMTHHAYTTDFLYKQWCVHEARTVLRSLLLQAIRPVRLSKLSTSASMSGRGCFKPPHALAYCHPSLEVRRRTDSVSVSPGISHFKHPLILEGNYHAKNHHDTTAT